MYQCMLLFQDNRTSLIQYVVMLYVQRYEMDDAGTDKVKLPLPDPSDITQASLVNFDDITKETARIRRDFACELQSEWPFNHAGLSGTN